ncbi:MAG: bifunctional diguanylate cyclase/phosphodiesterase [Gammaproteobacteria bacterium]|nr:bifunctional diguanylate cyclase/phosphodiesterase [Gammaproteobacteria bacterium]
MSLRFKLILSFVTASLTIVLIFSAISYNSAKSYSHQNELDHAHKNNIRLIDMLDTKGATLEQIERMIPHHKEDDSFYIVIDSETGNILSQQESGEQNKILNQVIRHTGMTSGESQGITSIQNENYFWATNSIPGTSYLLLNTFLQTGESVSRFLNFIGLALGITIFIALWFSFWAATILANLYQRLANQKTEIEHKSRHDPLTLLPNRQSIGEIIQEAMIANDDDKENLLLCLVDIHGLKEINDSLGHECGDIILRQISKRLDDALRSSDRVGRFGGDKFAVILTHSKTTIVDEICHRLLGSLDSAFHVEDRSLFIGATLGIANYPDHADNPQTLIQKAEIALHKAKDSGKDFVIFETQHDKGNVEKLHLANDLRDAIRNGDLELHYQPQLNLRTGKIAGFEALSRWIHPIHGFISPDTFIDIAERTGIIKQLTEWVLATAIKQCAEWQKSYGSLTMSINLSARNLHDETLGKQIARLIRHWQVIPEKICLEITETAMMADPEHAMVLLGELDALGVKISIDDFGTGYSSLGYLKKLPVDEIKIDRSFVMNMKDDENDASIIRATVGLAHDLGLSVVAEGVENPESQDLLRALNCEYAQGYHICKPAPAKNISEFLNSLRSDDAKNDPPEDANSDKTGSHQTSKPA